VSDVFVDVKKEKEYLHVDVKKEKEYLHVISYSKGSLL